MFEAIVKDEVVHLLEKNKFILQHGFRKGSSCLTNLLLFARKQSNMTHWLTGIIGYLHDVDSELMKAFSFLSS